MPTPIHKNIITKEGEMNPSSRLATPLQMCQFSESPGEILRVYGSRWKTPKPRRSLLWKGFYWPFSMQRSQNWECMDYAEHCHICSQNDICLSNVSLISKHTSTTAQVTSPSESIAFLLWGLCYCTPWQQVGSYDLQDTWTRADLAQWLWKNITLAGNAYADLHDWAGLFSKVTRGTRI